LAEIAVAIIAGIFTFCGTIVTVAYGNKKNEKNVKSMSDLTLYRISQLEAKVEKHNGVIERVYALEKHEAVVDEEIAVANHRIEDLEQYHK
jgi:hypothetical protein